MHKLQATASHSGTRCFRADADLMLSLAPKSNTHYPIKRMTPVYKENNMVRITLRRTKKRTLEKTASRTFEKTARRTARRIKNGIFTGVPGRLLAGINALIIALSLLPMSAQALGSSYYTSTQMLTDNLQYVNTIYYGDSTGRGESFALLMTGPGEAYPIVMKNDTIYGTFKMATMVSYAQSLGKNLIAAVNTDFFSIDSGVPIGIVIEDGIYKSSPNNRNAVCFGYDGSISIIEPAAVTMKLLNNGGSRITDSSGSSDDSASSGSSDSSGSKIVDNTGASMEIYDLNKTRSEYGGLSIYSEAFSTVSTRTSSPGWFVRLKILEGMLTVEGSMQLEVTEKTTSNGAVPIGEGYLILTASDKSALGFQYDKFEVGDIVTMTTTCGSEVLRNARYATGGGDILIKNGVKIDSESWTPSLKPKAPRTAFGIKADGSIISYVIDGRNSSHSTGATLDELADELLRQGCVNAVNFDGGGSSTLAVRLPGEDTAKTVNKPSDGSERGCSTFLLFVTDAASDGKAKNLSLLNNGAVLLTESSIELTYTARDSGFMPSTMVPEDIIAESADPNAVIEGSIYTAGSIAGPDTLRLYSPSTGAEGVGEIYVISRPTSMTALRKDSPTPLSSVTLTPSEVLELDIRATYFTRNVTAQPHSFEYAVTGDIGEMTEPGVFTAGQTLDQKGTITITAGGRSIEISVEISGFEDMKTHWAKEYAEYLYRLGITSGVGANLYAPEAVMKRCDFILMLYRAAGMPQVNIAAEGEDFSGINVVTGFDDVPLDAYYAEAVAWAKEAGITSGTSEGTFSPQTSLTRQQAFTFVYRAFPTLGIEHTEADAENLSIFEDAQELSDYAILPAAKLVELGIVEGSGSRLNPLATLTRAQMAKILAVTLQI